MEQALHRLFLFLSFLGTIKGSNIALYKPTTQSSTFAQGYSWRAVDGKNSSDYKDASCTHTKSQRMPWWRVDLLETRNIWLVKITGRSDCCWDRLDYVQVKVGYSLSRSRLCSYSVMTFGKGETKSFMCTTPISGRYVYIVLMSTDFLTLCNVEVFDVGASKHEILSHNLTGNIARNGTAKQSTTYGCVRNQCLIANASRAIDGILNSTFSSRSCSSTTRHSRPWWMVDLGARYVVRKVVLTNRGDCCEIRLRSIEIRVGDDACNKDSNPLAMYIPGQVGKGFSLKIFISRRRGQFVYVSLRRTDNLTLCEVQVFAEKGAPLPSKRRCTKRKRGGSQFGTIIPAVLVPIFVIFCCCRERGKRRAPGNGGAAAPAAPAAPAPAPETSTDCTPRLQEREEHGSVSSEHEDTRLTDSTSIKRQNGSQNGTGSIELQPVAVLIPEAPPMYEEVDRLGPPPPIQTADNIALPPPPAYSTLGFMNVLHSYPPEPDQNIGYDNTAFISSPYGSMPSVTPGLPESEG